METTDVLVYYVEDLGKIAETDSLSSLLTLRGTCSIDSIPNPNIIIITCHGVRKQEQFGVTEKQ
jgi:hypothetical protein